ncbi:DUF4328 domain-containing protein [Streptomyces actinomycinicus]|uniref:DUF4328 domain-containing protein n=1 Tax=Streptomyces actinomycinicus TaxID=1695166 RepID=A0A937EFY1_9ACTN|nr:DUF4328 domain-containing protein [Streptomyces actinomycinicus]MBL1081359.1 DUF4328 domain-containing protein [Streptomyces actinomycinicus]
MTSPMPAPPMPMVPGPVLRKPVGLGRTTAVLLGLVIATDLFAVWAGLGEIDVAGDIADGATGGGIVDRADRADTFYSAAGVLQTAALLATGIVYLCWVWRVRVNAEVFNPGGHSKSRGWTIGGWFCPVVNLWFPRRIVLDIWDSSAAWAKRPGHAIVNFWWALWIVSLLAGRVAARLSARAETAAEIRDAARQMLYADVLDIGAAVLAVLVVLKITRMQHRRALEGPVPAPALV